MKSSANPNCISWHSLRAILLHRMLFNIFAQASWIPLAECSLSVELTELVEVILKVSSRVLRTPRGTGSLRRKCYIVCKGWLSNDLWISYPLSRSVRCTVVVLPSLGGPFRLRFFHPVLDFAGRISHFKLAIGEMVGPHRRLWRYWLLVGS
jgi:hypothetical protein